MVSLHLRPSPGPQILTNRRWAAKTLHPPEGPTSMCSFPVWPRKATESGESSREQRQVEPQWLIPVLPQLSHFLERYHVYHGMIRAEDDMIMMSPDDDPCLFFSPSFQMRVFKVVIKIFPRIKHIKCANIYRVDIQHIFDL